MQTLNADASAIALAHRQKQIQTRPITSVNPEKIRKISKRRLQTVQSRATLRATGFEHPIHKRQSYRQTAQLPIFSCKRFIWACGAVSGQARLVTRVRTPQALFFAVEQQKRNTLKMFV